MRSATSIGWWYGRLTTPVPSLMSRTLGRDGQEQLGRGDVLPAGAVVLTDPDFVERELVQPGEQLQITL